MIDSAGVRSLGMGSGEAYIIIKSHPVQSLTWPSFGQMFFTIDPSKRSYGNPAAASVHFPLLSWLAMPVVSIIISYSMLPTLS